MENFLLVMILGVLSMYFFSSMSIYKSLYRKVNEEKNLLGDDSEKYQKLVKQLEHQLKSDANIMKGSYDNLVSAREETQTLRLENQNLKQKIDQLEKRTDELYAQVNTLV